MQTEFTNVSNGLENVYPGDWVILYNKDGYKKLVQVIKKSKTQVSINDGNDEKYNIYTGKKVPNNNRNDYFLRALTSDEIDSLDALTKREIIILSIKNRLHSLDIEKLNQMSEICGC